ncbi:MAG: phosphatidylglycerol lysyltransferase domain-containing protein [Candidatus Eremiobacterota bacterium]
MDDQRILELLKRYGRNLHSFEVLEPGLRYWFSSLREGAVAYVDRGLHWVTAGGPLCAREHLAEVAAEFAREAGRRRRLTAFFGVSHRFVEQLDDRFDWLQLGQQPCWDPQRWAPGSKARNRIRHFTREGGTVRPVGWQELRAGSPLLERARELERTWVTAHPMPPMRFMVTLDLFSYAPERRYFAAEEGSRLVGLAVAVPVYGFGGWLLEDLLVDRGAAGGAAEALIDVFMRGAAQEGSTLASLGMVPLAGVEGYRDRRHRLLTWILLQCYRSFDWLYGFQGLYRFRSKLNPHFWEPVYVASHGRVSFLTVRAVLMAFAGGWLPVFAARAARWRLFPASRRN